MTDIEKMELAIRRVTAWHQKQVPRDMLLLRVLDRLADELASGPLDEPGRDLRPTGYGAPVGARVEESPDTHADLGRDGQ